MKITIDIPVGTSMLLKMEQLHQKGSDGKPINLDALVVQNIEKYYASNPITPLLIDEINNTLDKYKENKHGKK